MSFRLILIHSKTEDFTHTQGGEEGEDNYPFTIGTDGKAKMDG